MERNGYHLCGREHSRCRAKLAVHPHTGRVIWSGVIGGFSPEYVPSTPAVADSGIIYAGGFRLYAFNPRRDEPNWQFNAGSPVNSSLAIASDGTIYFGTGDMMHPPRFYALLGNAHWPAVLGPNTDRNQRKPEKWKAALKNPRRASAFSSIWKAKWGTVTALRLQQFAELDVPYQLCL